MSTIHFVHADEDVPALLSYAAGRGLAILIDEPTVVRKPKILSEREIAKCRLGTFQIFRKDWVFGPFKFERVETGRNAGKYFVRPRTNYAGLALTFSGEVKERQRLGAGSVTALRTWQRYPSLSLEPTPTAVALEFRAMRKKFDPSVRYKGGGFIYRVLPGALKKMRDNYVPPFDFLKPQAI